MHDRTEAAIADPGVWPGRSCSPRHVMPINSRNEVPKCGEREKTLPRVRGQSVVNDVAGIIREALPGRRRRRRAG